MLPVGLHLSFWQTKWSDDLVPLIRQTKQAGFDVCEFPLLNLDELPLDTLRGTLDDCAMLASCSTGLNQTQDITSPDLAIRKKGIDYLQKCLQAASKLGSPVLVGVTYAPWGFFPSDDLSARRKQSITSLKEISLMAQDLGILICLEVINRFEGYLLNTAEQGVAFLEEVQNPAVRLHLDTFHMNIEEDNIAGAIRFAGKNLGHLHCEANNRKAPGRGHISWDEVFLALHDVNYQGYVIAEVFVNPVGEVGRGLSIWHPLATDLVKTAEETATFLKQKVADVYY